MTVQSRRRVDTRRAPSSHHLAFDLHEIAEAPRAWQFALMAYETKTRQTEVSVADYVAALDNPRRRADAEALIHLMGEISGLPAKLWGPTMIGFGNIRYTYDSGHTGTMLRFGFAPRAANTVIYASWGFEGAEGLIGRLGKVKRSKACLYVNKLDDIDMGVLREFLQRGFAESYRAHPEDEG